MKNVSIQEYLKKISKVEITNLLVCVVNIEHCREVAKAMSVVDTFIFMDKYRALITESVTRENGYVVNFSGDKALIIFSDADLSRGVQALLKLKKTLEEFINSKGLKNEVSFALDFGPAAVGYTGREPNRQIDIHGDVVTGAALILGQPVKGRFNMTPNLFNKLDKDVRQIFQRYTLPYIYTVNK